MILLLAHDRICKNLSVPADPAFWVFHTPEMARSAFTDGFLNQACAGHTAAFQLRFKALSVDVIDTCDPSNEMRF